MNWVYFFTAVLCLAAVITVTAALVEVGSDGWGNRVRYTLDDLLVDEEDMG